MSWVKTEKSNYQNIANAIRTKAGSSDTFLPSEMAAAIQAIPSGSSVFTDCNRTGAVYGKCEFTNGIDTERLSINPSADTKYFLAICEVSAHGSSQSISGFAYALTNISGTIVASNNGGTAGAMNITKINNFFQFASTITEDSSVIAQYVMKSIYEIK